MVLTYVVELREMVVADPSLFELQEDFNERQHKWWWLHFWR